MGSRGLRAALIVAKRHGRSYDLFLLARVIRFEGVWRSSRPRFWLLLVGRTQRVAVARAVIGQPVAHVSSTAGAREPRFGTNARRPLAPVHPAAAGISSGTAPNRHASKITAPGSDLAPHSGGLYTAQSDLSAMASERVTTSSDGNSLALISASALLHGPLSAPALTGSVHVLRIRCGPPGTGAG